QRGAVRQRLKGRRWLVEADVAVLTEAEDFEIDAARPPHRALVARTLASDVTRRAVEEMDALRVQVDVIEEVRVHERAIAVRITGAEAEELIEVECRRVREVDTTGVAQPHQLAVERQRRPAGWQRQHEAR